MKGKLSRMWRSGLSMMLALVMMFSLGTVAFATEGNASDVAKDVAEDVTVVAQELAQLFKDQADIEKAEAIAQYVYGSFAEQGYVALVVEALEATKAGLVAAKNEVANAVSSLSPELKAELSDALDSAINAVGDLIDVAKSVEDVNSDVVKAAVAVAVEKLDSVKAIADEIGAAGTLDDALVIKNLVVDACSAALNAAEKLADLLVAAIYDATHETIVVPCAGYKVAAVGDASVETYAADVAANLGGELSDVASADLVLMGYSAYSMTNFVADQLRAGRELNWSALADVVKDTNYVDAACGAIYDKLIAAGLTSELADAAVVVLESYAYAYAKYVLDYPVEVKNITDSTDAVVAVIGLYNPLQGVVLTEGDVSIDLGLCLETLIEASGLYSLASAMLMEDCIYIDVTDANVDTNMAPATVTITDVAGLLVMADGMLPSTGDEIEAAVMDALDVVYSGHVAVYTEAVEPDCTEPGYTAGSTCAVCGMVLEGVEEIPALGHAWDAGVVTPADRYLETLIIFTCERCGETKSEAYNKFHQHFFDGYPDATFRPEGEITRAEVAIVFYQLLNDKYELTEEQEANYVAKGTFADVDEAWFTMQIEVLESYGLVAGDPEVEGVRNFRPWDPITRAEFATMAVALAQFAIDGTEEFPDVAESDWFYDFVRTAANNGLVIGDDKDGDGTLEFRPMDNITRAEACVVACNMAGRPLDTIVEYFDYYMDGGVIPVDVELNVANEVVGVNEWAEIRVLSDIVGHWAYSWMLSALNDHFHELELDLLG